MLKDYVELINKHFAKDLRKPMRDAAKQLYDESIDSNEHIYQVWVPPDGKVDPLLVEDAVIELLYECSQRGYRFGDYRVETSEVTDGSPNPKYKHIGVTVSIPIMFCKPS